MDILLVEDNPADARLAAEALRESSFDNRLHWASDGVQAMAFLRREGKDAEAPRPDLILLDLNLPKKDGREVLAEVKGDPSLKRIPVVVLTTSQADSDRNRSYELHANCYFVKPRQWDEFVELMHAIGDFWFTRVSLPDPLPALHEKPSALVAQAVPAPIHAAREGPAGERKVLLVEDSPSDARIVHELLTNAGRRKLSLSCASTLGEAMSRLREQPFDAILLDLSLPDSGGLDGLASLHGRVTGVPIIVLTGLKDEALAARALRQGAQDYVVKGKFDGDSLSRALEHAIERTRGGIYVEYLAHHDTLTDLPNRTLLHDRLCLALEHARRNRLTLAVLFIDLDHFKEINDGLGHGTGDQLLQAVGARLCGSVRASDTVARVGGDEFTILFPEIKRTQDLGIVSAKILNSFRAPFLIGRREISMTASIGASLYPNDGEDADSLLKSADSAMYRAKEHGRNNFELHSSGVASLGERQSLNASLQEALRRDQLVLHYQPTVDAVSGQIVSLEALLRWQHPDGSLLRPSRFLPLAEESGLIVEIGAWVLRAACLQGRSWQSAGLPPLRVAVNVSHRQLSQGRSLIETVEAALRESGLEPRRLEIEVKEASVMYDESTAIRTLRALHDMGIRISIDDFGTGYASLSRLKCFPFGSVKIDRTFIRDVTFSPDDAAMVAAITAMAHSLRMNVVAEGVQTGEQVSYLLRNQIDQMQGPYFSKPRPAEECTELIAAGKVTLHRRRKTSG